MLVYGFDSCIDYASFVRERLLEKNILSKDFFNDNVFRSGQFFSLDFKFPDLQRDKSFRALANYALVSLASLSVERSYSGLELHKKFRVGSVLNNLVTLKNLHALDEGEDWKLSVILDDIGFVDDDYAVGLSRDLASFINGSDYKEVLLDSHVLPLGMVNSPVLAHAYKEGLYQGSAFYLKEETKDIFSSSFLDDVVKAYSFLSGFKDSS